MKPLKMFKRSIKFMPWEQYKARVDFLDMFEWQQSVRRDNIGVGA